MHTIKHTYCAIEISRWFLALEYCEIEAVHKHNGIHRACYKDVGQMFLVIVRKHLSYVQKLTHVVKAKKTNERETTLEQQRREIDRVEVTHHVENAAVEREKEDCSTACDLLRSFGPKRPWTNVDRTRKCFNTNVDNQTYLSRDRNQQMILCTRILWNRSCAQTQR